MKLKAMKEYLENMGRFKKSLVALQLIAVSEANEVRKKKDIRFISTLVASTINKTIFKRFGVSDHNTIYIPLTLDSVGCGLHNTLVLRTMLSAIAGTRSDSLFIVCISMRTRLFLTRKLEVAYFVQARNILKDDLSFFYAFLFYLMLTSIPRFHQVTHLSLVFNMCQTAHSAEPFMATLATQPLFIVSSLDRKEFSSAIPTYICSFVLTLAELFKENHLAGSIFKIMALTDAVNNCDSLLKEITRKYHRLRQESITNSLLELSSFII